MNARTLVSPGLAIPVLAAVAACLAGTLLVLALGFSLGDALSSFVDGTIGSHYALAVSLNRSVVYALVGLGFILANRAGLTNVGGEGQIAMGGMVAAAVALHHGVAALPFGLAFLLPLSAATLAGAAWGGLAGVLKARVGTNEVISTLLLSFIAVWLVYGSVQSVALLRQPMTSGATLPESLPVPDATQLPLLTGDAASPVTIGLPLAVVLAIGMAILLTRSRFGFQLRAVGLNPVAATRAGFAFASTVVVAMAIAGAFGGLAGGVMLLGEQFSLKAGFSSGYGYDGLVVGLLARGSVTGVVAAALLFGFLRSGGISMEMGAGVPTALVMVMQGLIVVAVAGAAFWLDRRGSRS
ncbi:ABC transporter permease [Beijerinckia sp. L45]|uniref:ABC transporter permease n=1 Tax=Beijerinckia sp. L45 TaxID=1641855 RepID=UPI00131AFDA3|nr:ABC transporter permease [Beijerinckia sp. L45]